MKDATFSRDETYVLRLTKDKDLLEQLTEYCDEKSIDAGKITVLGAVTEATIGFYDQEDEHYAETSLDKPMEIIQAVGNVSYLDGERFVHMHGTFADEEGNVYAGHLLKGCNVFAGEATVQVLSGPDLVRKDDPATGLTLWDL